MDPRRKVVIPAGTIGRIDVDDKKIFVALTKDQIKDSPEYDAAKFDEGYAERRRVPQGARVGGAASSRSCSRQGRR